MNFAYSNCTDMHIEIDGMCFGFQISNIFFVRVYLFEPDRFTFNLPMKRLYFTTHSGEGKRGRGGGGGENEAEFWEYGI